MTDPIRELQRELRSSLNPVSAFFLVDSDAALTRLAEKLRCLLPYGVSDEQVGEVAEVVARLRARHRPEDDFRERVRLDFRVGEDARPGFVEVRGAPGHGLEVEVILPGVVASSAAGFLVDGFFCGFMPPSFYR
jgi:hypothetical protein